MKKRGVLRILTVLTATGIVAVTAGGAALLTGEPIHFQSEESSTPEFGPILNRVQWIAEEGYDLWIMQQNQERKSHPFLKWDRLAILVDNTKSPKEARFFQLKPGTITPSLAELRHEREFRVSCGNCHTNGPRALRPVFKFFGKPAEEPAVTLSLRDFARAQLWNLRIKTYGRVVTPGNTTIGARPRRMPFHFPANEPPAKLEVKACTICHNDTKWGRGTLTRENFTTIKHMVDNGHMPPPGFPLSAQDRREIDAFVSTF